MIDIDIQNPEVLELLDYALYNFRSKWKPEQDNRLIGHLKEDPNKWISDEYRDKIIAMGRNHGGLPEMACSYALKPEHYLGDRLAEYTEDFEKFDVGLRLELGLRCNALSQLYPPKGFIGWHTNADAPGHNLIFTWSETGDGWFKYIDENGQEITMHDRPGWTLKAGYFGTYDENKPCYHAAYTNCWRMTHSFVLSNDTDYWKDCIEHISTR